MNIIEIASMCGVSPATVSRVINNNPKVNGATREKVLRALQETDYIPNAFASAIGRNSMKLVGILCADIANPYYAKAVSYLVNGLRTAGFDSLLYCTGSQLAEKKIALSDLLQKRVDTIILVGSAYREERDNTHIREAARQTPIFMVNAYVQIPNVYCVLCDEREAMQTGIRRMVDLGHREILYLHDMKKWKWAGSQKMQGYLDGLSACGIPENRQLIQCVENGMQDAAKCVEKLMREGVRFSGIVASEDILAVGALKAVNAMKADVAVLGFNNSDYTLCCAPELASIDNMLDTICPATVDMLSKLSAGKKITSKLVVSSCIIERESLRKHG
jgi:LacI family transcriptional regulator/LacI family asc operon transcriptional repressor